MNKPFPSYMGSDAYIFVCYAHKDAEQVYSDLLELDGIGINLWYDEGIAAGSSWRAGIADAISGASKLLFFISENSLQSTHCLREVDYALNHDLQIVPVYLDHAELPGELELALSRVQALYRKSDTRYMERLQGALERPAALAPLQALKNKRQPRLTALSALLACIVFSIGLWIQFSPFGESQSSIIDAETSTSSDAYDRYLTGMDLMQRWDKDENLESATALFEEAVSLDPNFSLSYARLAEAYRIQYALSGNTDFLDSAVRNIDIAIGINSGLAPVQVVLGRIRAAQGNLDLAFAALERALALDPNEATANAAIARLYERQGRFGDAEEAFERSIALEPENLLNLDSYANFLYRQSRYEEAAQQWRIVIQLAPDHYAALTNLGASLNQIGSTTEAIQVYQQALATRQTYMTWVNLGTVYWEARQYDDAIVAFTKAISLNEIDWLAWGNLADTYYYQDERGELAAETFSHAIQLAEASRAQNLRDPYLHSDLGHYYAKTGNFTLATQRITAALALSPESGEIHAAAAEVYELVDEHDTAIEHAQRAIDLGYPMRQFTTRPVLAELLTDNRLSSQF